MNDMVVDPGIISLDENCTEEVDLLAWCDTLEERGIKTQSVRNMIYGGRRPWKDLKGGWRWYSECHDRMKEAPNACCLSDDDWNYMLYQQFRNGPNRDQTPDPRWYDGFATLTDAWMGIITHTQWVE